jgi:hypothetical protein
VVSSPPATEEIGAMRREIESRKGVGQGCQMVYFQTKNPNLGTLLGVLQWKLLVYFMSNWYTLQPFAIFNGHFV